MGFHYFFLFPWLATVAAGTHDRVYVAKVTLGDGAVYTGVGLGAAVPSSPLILSTNAGLAGADPAAVSLCFSSGWAGAPQLDPAKVAGKIVQCDRGVNDRVDKSLAVKEAGGVGMILTNVSNNTLNADLHSVPPAGHVLVGYIASRAESLRVRRDRSR